MVVLYMEGENNEKITINYIGWINIIISLRK